MLRNIAACIAVFLLTMTAQFCNALEMQPHSFSYGEFKTVNTGGFIEENGIRRNLPTDTNMGNATFSPSPDGKNLLITVNESRIEVFQLENGLASFHWDARDSNLLHRNDVLDLAGEDDLKDIHAWGAEVDWPKIGNVTFILFSYAHGSYGGFLISKPRGTLVVRQMEFNRMNGPRHRANDIHLYNLPEHRR